MAWQTWKQNSLPELLNDIKRVESKINLKIAAIKLAESDPDISAADISEMWQEVSEQGLIIGQLKKLAAECYGELYSDLPHSQTTSTAKPLPPDQLQLQMEDGIQLIKERNHHLAIPIFKTILLHNPTHYMAHYQLGLAWLGLNKYQLAVDEFTAALRLKPDFVDALLKRAEGYGQLYTD